MIVLNVLVFNLSNTFGKDRDDEIIENLDFLDSVYINDQGLLESALDFQVAGQAELGNPERIENLKSLSPDINDKKVKHE